MDVVFLLETAQFSREIGDHGCGAFKEKLWRLQRKTVAAPMKQRGTFLHLLWFALIR